MWRDEQPPSVFHGCLAALEQLSQLQWPPLSKVQSEWARALLWFREGTKQQGNITQGEDLRIHSTGTPLRKGHSIFSAKKFHIESLIRPGNNRAKPTQSIEKEI